MADDAPIYNLKAVTKETGLKPATLRAWERRYGLIKPQRSAGGQRLYTRQDVEILKWLVARQNEGLSISRAVAMWRELDQSGISPPVPILHGESGKSGSMIDELRDQWIAACLKFDDQSANRVLQQAFVIASPETVSLEVLQKGMALIGEGWYDDSVSVQQEHFASAIAIRRLNALITATTAPKRPESILVICPPGEEHDFILLLVTYLLRRNGWNTLYLGSNVPLIHLDNTLVSTQPTLIISAAQTLNAAASLRAMSEYLFDQGVRLAFGGGIFLLEPGTIKRISGYYLGDNVAVVPRAVDLLIKAAPDMHRVEPVPVEYPQVLAGISHNEDAINEFVTSSITPDLLSPNYLEIAYSNFTQLIKSALTLGDLSLMDHSITWLNGLLINSGIAPVVTRQFYTSYRKAVEHYLGDAGRILRDWLITVESQEFERIPGQSGQ